MSRRRKQLTGQRRQALRLRPWKSLRLKRYRWPIYPEMRPASVSKLSANWRSNREGEKMASWEVTVDDTLALALGAGVLGTGGGGNTYVGRVWLERELRLAG